MHNIGYLGGALRWALGIAMIVFLGEKREPKMDWIQGGGNVQYNRVVGLRPKLNVARKIRNRSESSFYRLRSCGEDRCRQHRH